MFLAIKRAWLLLQLLSVILVRTRDIVAFISMIIVKRRVILVCVICDVCFIYIAFLCLDSEHLQRAVAMETITFLSDLGQHLL